MPRGPILCNKCWRYAGHQPKNCKGPFRARPAVLPPKPSAQSRRNAGQSSQTASAAASGLLALSQGIATDDLDLPGAYNWTDVTPNTFEFMDESDFIAEAIDKPAFQELQRRKARIGHKVTQSTDELAHFEYLNDASWVHQAAKKTQPVFQTPVRDSHIEGAFCSYFMEVLRGERAHPHASDSC